MCLLLDATTQTTSAAGGDETDLLTGRATAANSGGVANVLMVATTVGVINGVHCDTTNLGPLVTLGPVLVASATGLGNRLVHAATTGDDADHGTAIGAHSLAGTGWELDTGQVLIGDMRNDGDIVPRCTGELAAISGRALQVAHDGTFWHGADGEDVADVELSLLTAVHVLTSVHTLSGDEQLLISAVVVSIAELDLAERSATTRVVHNVVDDTLDVSVALGEVDGAKLGGSLAVVGVSSEDGTTTLTLCADDATHFPVCVCERPSLLACACDTAKISRGLGLIERSRQKGGVALRACMHHSHRLRAECGCGGGGGGGAWGGAGGKARGCSASNADGGAECGAMCVKQQQATVCHALCLWHVTRTRHQGLFELELGLEYTAGFGFV